MRKIFFPRIVLMLAGLAISFTAGAQSICGPLPYDSLPWGIKVLDFPSAWQKVCGTANVAVLDRGIYAPGGDVHPLLAQVRKNLASRCDSDTCEPQRMANVCPGPGGGSNFCRTNLSFVDELPHGDYGLRGHGTHVAGIIAASHEPAGNIVGGCRNCSLLITQTGTDATQMTASLRRAVETGAQVVNISQGVAACGSECNSYRGALDRLLSRDVPVVAASGNSGTATINFPASHPGVMAVGGLARDPFGYANSFWSGATDLVQYPGAQPVPRFGSQSGPQQWVVAPAAEVLSTFYFGSRWSVFDPHDDWSCKDIDVAEATPGVASSPPEHLPGSGIGICTGTSMAAPHVTAIVALMKSANPLLSASAIRNLVAQSSGSFPNRTDQLGYGVPSARTAVRLALGDGDEAVMNRLTPLFSLAAVNSPATSFDHLYTVVPQVAMSAIEATLPPSGFSSSGTLHGTYAPIGHPASSLVPGYVFPQCATCPPWPAPLAVGSVFTSHRNPVANGPELVPLYRMSRQCRTTACNLAHAGHAYAVQDTYTPGELTTFRNAGFEVDAIEGFIFPRNQPSPPAGTVKLCRRYDAVRDDYLLFPGAGTGPGACDVIPPDFYNGNPYGGSYADLVTQGLPVGDGWIGYFYYPVVGSQPVLPIAAQPPAQVAVFAGNGQQATINAGFAQPLQARVTDASGNPSPNATVSFVAPSSGPSANTWPTAAVSDANGIASVQAAANDIAGGPYPVYAYVPGVTTPATFSLTNRPAPVATTLSITSGSGQSAAVGTTFAQPLAVIVRDQFSQPYAGATVTFYYPSSGPSGMPSASPTTTNASGVASITITANHLPGTFNIVAVVAGLPNASFLLTNLVPAIGSFTAISGTPQTTPLSAPFPVALGVRVMNLGNPVRYANIAFTAPASGPSAILAATNILTDADGYAYVQATANTSPGSYTVVATVQNFATPVSFNLANDANGGFETPQLTSQYTYGMPANSGWSGSQVNTVGLYLNTYGNGAGLPSTPQGNQYAYFSNEGGVRQTRFLAAGTYALSALALRSAAFPSVSLRALLNGAELSNAVPSAASWTPFTTLFTVGTAGDQLLELGGVHPNGFVGWLFLDDVKVIANPALTLGASSGTGQTAVVNTNFGASLVVHVGDSSGNPVANVPVTFTSPASGASATFNESGTNTATVNTNGAGVASATAHANATAGSFNVTATSPYATGAASFALANSLTEQCTPGPYMWEIPMLGHNTMGPTLMPRTGWVAAYRFSVAAGDYAWFDNISPENYVPAANQLQWSISKCKGDFSAPPACQGAVGLNGSIAAVAYSYPGSCVIEPNATYYLNVKVLECAGGDGACGERLWRTN